MIVDLIIKHWEQIERVFHRRNPRFIRVTPTFIDDRIQVVSEYPDLEKQIDNLITILANINSQYKEVAKAKKQKITTGMYKGCYQALIGHNIYLTFAMPQNAELQLIRLCTLQKFYTYIEVDEV